VPIAISLNKKWSDSLRTKLTVPPNDTTPIANVSCYKSGTSMEDNTHLFLRPPKDDGGFYTVEDAARNGHSQETRGVEFAEVPFL
jgi:hypothetical protein